MDTPLTDIVHKENPHVGGGKTTTMRKHIKLKQSGKKHKALAKFRDTYALSFGASNDVDLKLMANEKQQIAWENLFTTKNQIVNSPLKVTNLNTPNDDLHNLMSFSGPIFLHEELDGTLDERLLDKFPKTKLILEDDFDLDNDNRIGEKTTMRKPIKLKAAGNKHKALEGFRDTFASSSGVSNDVDLKPMTHGKQQIAGADLFTTKNLIGNRESKVANPNTGLLSLKKRQWLKKNWGNYRLSDEDIKKCIEWAKEGIEQKMCCNSCSTEDEETFYKNQTLSGTFAPAIGLRIAELEQPIQSDDEDYKIDDPDLQGLLSFSGTPNIIIQPYI